MMNEKHICAGNIGDINFMCMSAILPIMKRGNDAIGSCHWVKSKLPFRELFRSTNFCIQIMWQKGSTFLAIVTPFYKFAP